MFTCPGCGVVVAKTDKRRLRGQSGWLRSVGKARVQAIVGLAARIKCSCGHTSILLRGGA